VEQISDHELGMVRELVSLQRAIPALVVESIIARLDRAEGRIEALDEAATPDFTDRLIADRDIISSDQG
jgi:hypothetical protein